VLGAISAIVPASAHAQQSFSLYLGGFVPRGEDARSDDDVLVANLTNGRFSLEFDVDDFNGATVGGEWLFGLTDHVDAGLGIGVYSKTVPSLYSFLTHANRDEIEQDLKLRIVPFTATVRFLPLGRRDGIEPYIGAGVGVFAYRYSEIGEFVDPFDLTIFQDRYVKSGATAGPVVLGGVAFPVGSWSIGGEIRYQSAQGELPEDEFIAREIDLGGFNYLATFKVRF
jgi:hypothetical protein